MRLKTILIIMFITVSSIPIGIIWGIEGFRSSIHLLVGLIFLVTFTVSLVISYFITRPLEHLTKNIDEISKGKLDVNLEYSDINEVNNLVDSLNRVMASLKLAIHKVGIKKGEIFEDAIKEKEQFEKQHQDFINNINGWAWETDDKGIYTYISKNVSKCLGYEPDEVIGKTFFDFISSDNVKQIKQQFNKASKEKVPITNLVNWNIRKDGRKICMLTNAVPFFNNNNELKGFRGVDFDITSEKNAEEKIKKLSNELTNLRMEITELLNKRDKSSFSDKDLHISHNEIDEKWSEHEFDSVFIFDEKANILDCNENMYKRLGYSKSEMLDLNMADFDALETKDDIIEKIKKAKKTGVISFKTIHKRKDGSAILVYENLQYLKDYKSFKAIVREDYSLKKSS